MLKALIVSISRGNRSGFQTNIDQFFIEAGLRPPLFTGAIEDHNPFRLL